MYVDVLSRVKYQLSPMVCTLLCTIRSLVRRTDENQLEIARAGERFDTDAGRPS